MKSNISHTLSRAVYLYTPLGLSISLLACNIVAEDPGCDDVAARREYPLEVGLSHVLGEAAHVEVRPLYGFAARPRVRNLSGRVGI